MRKKLSVRQLDVSGRRVFCRVDFNVPVARGTIEDDTRIRASLPTLELLARGGARAVLASHLGRPKGEPRPELSLRPVAARLSELLGRPVRFVAASVGPEAEDAAAALEPGGFLLLENLRFHAGETANDTAFSAALARLGELYVSDAFGAAHRAHASTAGVPKLLRPAAAGLLLERELEYLGRLLDRPEPPFVAILGGAKVSDKIELIESLAPRVDRFLIGGAMAYTFLRASGSPVGRSRIEPDRLDLARELLARCRARGPELLLPVDHVVTTGERDDAPCRTTDGVEIGEDEIGGDIGPQTVARFGAALADARTVLWNGPLGRFEVESFSTGSRAIAECLASSSAVSVVGGGDTAAAVRRFGLTDRISHVSTGGGASLELLSGLPLPGVEALDDAP
jgi:phosphoglycerate kinase